MNILRKWTIHLLLWDCDYAIQRCNSSIKDLREEIVERKMVQAQLKVELFNLEHQLIGE